MQRYKITIAQPTLTLKIMDITHTRMEFQRRIIAHQYKIQLCTTFQHQNRQIEELAQLIHNEFMDYNLLKSPIIRYLIEFGMDSIEICPGCISATLYHYILP